MGVELGLTGGREGAHSRTAKGTTRRSRGCPTSSRENAGCTRGVFHLYVSRMEEQPRSSSPNSVILSFIQQIHLSAYSMPVPVPSCTRTQPRAGRLGSRFLEGAREARCSPCPKVSQGSVRDSVVKLLQGLGPCAELWGLKNTTAASLPPSRSHT